MPEPEPVSPEDMWDERTRPFREAAARMGTERGRLRLEGARSVTALYERHAGTDAGGHHQPSGPVSPYSQPAPRSPDAPATGAQLDALAGGPDSGLLRQLEAQRYDPTEQAERDWQESHRERERAYDTAYYETRARLTGADPSPPGTPGAVLSSGLNRRITEFRAEFPS